MQGENELRKERKVEGMNIEVGQWYRCREEQYLVHVVGPITHDTYKFVAVIYGNGEFEETGSFTATGEFYDDNDKCDFDLVEHLPDCTGPDWKPNKWRKATVQDAAAGKFCRVYTSSSAFNSKLQGFMNHGGFTSFYLANERGILFWANDDCVEVLDD